MHRPLPSWLESLHEAEFRETRQQAGDVLAQPFVGLRVLQPRELLGSLFRRSRLCQHLPDQQRRSVIQKMGLAGRMVIDDVLVACRVPRQFLRRRRAIGGTIDGWRGQTSPTGCAETASELIAVADIRMPRRTLTPFQPWSVG